MPERAKSNTHLNSAVLPTLSPFTELLEDATSTSLERRTSASHFIYKHGSALSGPVLDTLAREASYTSIAKALLHNQERLSYSARVELASAFWEIGRDKDVIACLGSIDRQDASGLRLYCDAISRGRFVPQGKINLEPYYFAATFGDASARLTWFEKFGIRSLKGSDLTFAITNLVNLATYDHDPAARVSLAQMLINRKLTSEDNQLAYRHLSLAAMDGYSPAKLALLQHFPGDSRHNVKNVLGEFLTEGFFPGIAHCYQVLSSANDAPVLIGSILKAYLWHPAYPVGTPAELTRAIEAAASIPEKERKEIQTWARGKVLILDTPPS